MKLRYSLLVLALFFLFLIILDTPVFGQRGKGRHRFRGRGGTNVSNVNPDPNSKMEYYNSQSGARIIKASHFDYEYTLGHKIVFLCEARGDPRPFFTWFKDGIELHYHPYLQYHEWANNTLIKSKMEIDPATQMDAGIYECHANNKYAIDRRTFKTDFSIGD
ncbi:hypothetical protein CHUAL_014104 [Chamberlinius hualienensis]